MNRIISEFERRFGFPLTDLDRSFLRAAMGLTLERGRYALDAWFLEAAADIPAHAFFEFEVDIDGRSVSHEEALFLGAMAACVTAKNRVAGCDALARWIDASPWFARLAESMAERFGAEPCATDLFRASLRRLYLFERIGAAATAFTQDRPVADAYRDVFDDTRTIMDIWKRDLPGPGTEANADLIAQFVLQITPLIDRRPVPPRFLCAVVTLSELNRLTISYAVTRRFSGTGQVVKGAFTDIASACAALDSAKDADAGALTMVIVDREYPTGEPTELEGHRIISASVVSGTDALAERIDRALSGART